MSLLMLSLMFTGHPVPPPHLSLQHTVHFLHQKVYSPTLKVPLSLADFLAFLTPAAYRDGTGEIMTFLLNVLQLLGSLACTQHPHNKLPFPFTHFLSSRFFFSPLCTGYLLSSFLKLIDCQKLYYILAELMILRPRMTVKMLLCCGSTEVNILNRGTFQQNPEFHIFL